ncbi:MAG: hypothetical protein RLZZ253_1621 [Verrucomicrobiota bacterium]
MGEQVALAFEGGFGAGEGLEFGLECGDLPVGVGVGIEEGLGSGAGIEEGELAFCGEKGLVVVWAVEVHKAAAQFFEGGEGGGAAIDELAVCTGRRERAAQEELTRLAGLDAEAFELGIERGQECRIGQVENGLDRAGICPGTDQGFVGALAHQEFEGTDDDGFAGAGFAGDSGEPGLEEPGEILDEGKVSDPEGGKGGGHGGQG